MRAISAGARRAASGRGASARVLGEGEALAKEERYREVRTWYARDRGGATLEEVLELVERGAKRRVA